MRPMTPGYGQSCALQRFGAVNECFRCSPAHTDHDLSLPKVPEAAIIARNSPGIGSTSVQIVCRDIHGQDQIMAAG